MGITIHLAGEVKDVERLVDAAKELAEKYEFEAWDDEQKFERQPLDLLAHHQTLPDSKYTNLISEWGTPFHVSHAKRGTPRTRARMAFIRWQLKRSDRATLHLFPAWPATKTTIRGVIINPHPESESLCLTFDEEGTLGSYIQLDGYVMATPVWCKTQFAGPLLHLRLLEYIANLEPYFDYFRLHDEADAWPLFKRHKSIEHPAVIRRVYQSWGEMEEVFAKVLGDLKALGYPESNIGGNATTYHQAIAD